MIGHPASAKPSYVMLVPLLEILAESLGGLPQGEKIKREYERMVANFGSEFAILLDIPTEDIMHFSGPRVAEGIRKVRQGDIVIDPGYDGLFGVVKIWPSSSSGLREDVGENGGQLTLF
jgi:PHP family Zn ribbon phosphoesterase